MPDELASVAFSLREQILKSFIRFGDRFVADLTKCRVELRFFPRSLAGGFPGRLPAFGLPTEGMIVSLVDVVLHLGSQRWSDFTTAGFTSQMRSISVELSFQIPEDRTTRGEFLIGDGLLKFCVAFVHRRVERSGIEFFARHSKLVDKGEFKIAQAFDRGIASGFGKRCRATTRDENYIGAEENVSRNNIGFIWRSLKRPILRRFGPTCQDLRTGFIGFRTR